MPTPTRRGFSNTATPVTLVGTLSASGSTATITVNTTPSGWPGTLPYLAVIDRGTASEEVVLVTAASGTSMTITRGGSLSSPYGSTTKSHSNGASIEHAASAQDFDEANAHTSASSGVHGITGSVVGTTDTQTLTNKTLSSPTINTPTISNPTISGTASGGTWAGAVTGISTPSALTFPSSASPSQTAEGQVVWDSDDDQLTVGTGTTRKTLVDTDLGGTGAYSTYTPSIGGTGWALGNGTITGRYSQDGKRVTLHIEITFGSTSTFGSGGLTLSLPVNALAGNYYGVTSARDTSSTIRYPGVCRTLNATTVQPLGTLTNGGAGTYASENGHTTTTPFSWASTDQVFLDIVYEAA